MQVILKKLLSSIFLLYSAFAQCQVAQLSNVEIEKRNAATAFVLGREISLVLVIGECKHVLASSPTSIDAIAKGWFERNKLDLEAAHVWLDQYLSCLKSTDTASHTRASNEFLRSQGNTTIQNSRVFFARKMPDTASCEKAATTFATPLLDFKNMASNLGFERFAEFPETLLRFRSEQNYVIPPHLKLGFDSVNQKLNGVSNLASLDAAEAAKEKGDGQTRMAIFKGLAERGDGQAAQQVGIMNLNGQQIDKNPIEAYRWFYAAWSLSEMEGLNALGVMLRDGLGVPVNPVLALSSFYLAKAGARSRATFDRALGNLDKMAGQGGIETLALIACTRLSALDDALRGPIRALAPVLNGKPISSPERHLGSVVKDLSSIYQTANCL